MTQLAMFEDGLAIGLTGTRVGMTKQQHCRVVALLDQLKPAVGRHGDCIGSDAQFHILCLERGIRVVIHPPSNPKYRAWCSKASQSRPPVDVEVLPKAPYIVRDHAMVDAVQVLLATPKTEAEVLRSGTWSTVRYACKVGRKLFLITPTGRVEEAVRLTMNLVEML